MADVEQTADPDAERLEAALARIAGARPSAAARARLDALIGEVRAALGREPPE